MGDDRRVLIQFPISHYCEKSRWHLDLKGLPYEVRNVLPGAHVFINRRLGTGRTVPVLIDRGQVVGDSTRIALHLEERYPHSPLIPTSEVDRRRVLEIESYFDDTLGPALRHWAYSHVLRRGMLRSVFFHGYDVTGRLIGRFLSGVLGREIRRMYRIEGDSAEVASREIDAAVERLEELIGGDPERYLVGDRLTLADVTAASLFAPLVAPPGTPWGEEREMPPEFLVRRDALRARPAGKWVLSRYAKDRRAAAH